MIEDRIARAKQLLRTVRHAAMATVNEDGSPHNTPYRFMVDDTLQNLYWGSHPESAHSKNITRTGQIFVVLYDAKERGGLFIQADNAHVLSGAELEVALKIHNRIREAVGESVIPLSYYTEGQQRMYTAKPIKFWVNMSEKGPDGLLIKDNRHEISREQLL